ncbi:hypothetical protein QGN29_12605 [Temperatibacter marinus]|uniref:Uncharacterized protein n=1 Tax=Temperatibacter marinus TaxID=1456591 RepID=A0AA52H8R7_9PROT|nr:hypothetical protein [Temperatibacter marinus]WND02391.1 hypothetical protein QGN29_12605 [Temperatibacter marinus]
MNDLKTALHECKKLFNQHQEHFWGKKIHVILYKSSSEKEMAEKVLALPWEGAGSFPTLKISSANGHNIRATHEEAVNLKLKALQDEIFFMARFKARAKKEDES